MPCPFSNLPWNHTGKDLLHEGWKSNLAQTHLITSVCDFTHCTAILSPGHRSKTDPILHLHVQRLKMVDRSISYFNSCRIPVVLRFFCSTKHSTASTMQLALTCAWASMIWTSNNASVCMLRLAIKTGLPRT